MKKFLILALALITTVFAGAAFAGELKFATGGPKGTYHTFFEQTKGVCSSPVLTSTISKGSEENLDLILGNQVNGAFIQEDVLFAAKHIDGNQEVNSLRTLMPLYPEEVQMLVLSNSPLFKFSNLGNKRIAAFGGSLRTAKILIARTGIRLDGPVYAAKDEVQAMQWLNEGRVGAIIAVGGQPLPWIKALPGKYRLLEFDMFDKVNDIYQTATLNAYPNLKQSGVKTIATQSLLVVYNYTEGEAKDDVIALRSCLNQSLPNLRTKIGNHPKWRQVRAGDKSRWPMYGSAKVAKKGK